MFQKAKADMHPAQDMNTATMTTSETQVSDIYDSFYLHKTLLPNKMQSAFLHLQHFAFLNYLTTNSQKFDDSDENKRTFLTLRGDAFAEIQLYKEAVLDYTAAQKYKDDPNSYATLAYFAVLSHHNDLALQIIKYCKENNVQCHLAEGVYDL